MCILFSLIRSFTCKTAVLDCPAGHQLRKVEERKVNESKAVPGKVMGVQAIMEAAFEMRRKAMEDSDSDAGSDQDDDSAWDD